MEKRYWKAPATCEVACKVRSLMNSRHQMRQALIAEVGAVGGWRTKETGRLTKFVFKQKPVGKHWSYIQGDMYRPDRRFTEGKRIGEAMERTSGDGSLCLTHLLLGCWGVSVNARLHSCGFRFCGDWLLVTAIASDEWKPASDLVEIKASVYHRFIESAPFQVETTQDADAKA